MADRRIVTDLNARERARHVVTLRKLAEASSAAADALEAADDHRLLLQITLISLLGPAVTKELVDVLLDAAHVDIPDVPPPA